MPAAKGSARTPLGPISRQVYSVSVPLEDEWCPHSTNREILQLLWYYRCNEVGTMKDSPLSGWSGTCLLMMTSYFRRLLIIIIIVDRKSSAIRCYTDLEITQVCSFGNIYFLNISPLIRETQWSAAWTLAVSRYIRNLMSLALWGSSYHLIRGDQTCSYSGVIIVTAFCSFCANSCLLSLKKTADLQFSPIFIIITTFPAQFPFLQPLHSSVVLSWSSLKFEYFVNMRKRKLI